MGKDRLFLTLHRLDRGGRPRIGGGDIGGRRSSRMGHGRSDRDDRHACETLKLNFHGLLLPLHGPVHQNFLKSAASRIVGLRLIPNIQASDSS
jgi:hypothetical protein